MAVICKDKGGKCLNPTEFKSTVGGLRYLVHTRPDISYVIGIISHFLEKPTAMHLNATKRIMRYNKGTLNYGLIYSRDSANNVLTGYSDSDLAGHVIDIKSSTRVVFYLNESMVTWMSQKQKCMALWPCSRVRQNSWLLLQRHVKGYGYEIYLVKSRASILVLWFCLDNKSTINLGKNLVFQGRSKHIDIRYHFIREYVECGEIIIKHVRTEE
ncbi:secreted RxLR effector protein 161-like [Apium graveolens]|uniref:secreted RxLR effector protein 161-like n=1 Tax=Apium graveolens TaxID=4045 RepID=UPI003D7BFFB6